MASTMYRPDWDWIYFASCDEPDDYPVKIGFATNVPNRLKALQTGSPYPIRLFGAMRGNRTGEIITHAEFRHLRLNGEWFRRTPELMTFIAELDALDIRRAMNPRTVIELPRCDHLSFQEKLRLGVV